MVWFKRKGEGEGEVEAKGKKVVIAEGLWIKCDSCKEIVYRAEVGKLADGVIVGSAIVRVVEEHATSPSLVTKVGDFIEQLKAPLRAMAG